MPKAPVDEDREPLPRERDIGLAVVDILAWGEINPLTKAPRGKRLTQQNLRLSIATHLTRHASWGVLIVLWWCWQFRRRSDRRRD
jgi:hypothetical protein